MASEFHSELVAGVPEPSSPSLWKPARLQRSDLSPTRSLGNTRQQQAELWKMMMTMKNTNCWGHEQREILKQHSLSCSPDFFFSFWSRPGCRLTPQRMKKQQQQTTTGQRDKSSLCRVIHLNEIRLKACRFLRNDEGVEVYTVPYESCVRECDRGSEWNCCTVH